MQIELPYRLLTAAKSAYLNKEARNAKSRLYHPNEIDEDMLVSVDFNRLPSEDYPEVVALAEEDGNSRVARALRAVIEAEGGEFDKPVPNFEAFMPMLAAFLRQNAIRGWIFLESHDGYRYPYLVTKLTKFVPARKEDGPPRVALHLTAFGGVGNEGGRRPTSTSVTFEPSDVTRKKLTSILSDSNYLMETPALLTAYDEEMDYFILEVRDGFAQQFSFEGQPHSTGRWGGRKLSQMPKRKVIHDVPRDEEKAVPTLTESEILGDDYQIPAHPLVRVFDLADHEFFTTHAGNMTPYQFDKTLRDKLILPQSHRDLLDVLTTDLDKFLGDIVEGKSAGNIVICKGVPGVGKTLTAEIYSELIEKPMYSVHSGSLGTSATSVEGNLKVIFERQRRWNCVLLLDEADVFVVERGDNIEQNAIVAEFLRVLEYFDGLLFMTTNRPDSIDEAIISRAAAIIHYEVPGPVDRAKIWEVMLKNYQQDPPPGLVADLVDLFPTIAPRDIKMLLRLALRISTVSGDGLSVEVFRRCAMFRNVEIAPENNLV